MMLAIALALAAFVLFWFALRLRRQTGLPWSRVVADDTYGRTLDRPLFAPRYSLTGKPDYVLEQRGVRIPVEVKPNRAASAPYESDLMQLAAYCLLIEETSGTAPPYGLLRYRDTTYRLDYTDAVRDELLGILDEMHAALDDSDCPRDHNEPRRCAACGFVAVCDDALVE